MIGQIYSSSPSIDVSQASASNYINNYSGAQGVGNLRFNTVNQTLEVYDGATWIKLNTGTVGIRLSSETEALLDWARKKRNEEYELENLARDNPTINDLLEQIKTKQHQLKMVQTLIKNQNDDAGLLIKPSMIP